MIQVYGLSDVGCVRQNNEDRILIDEQLGFFVVADGMGGHGYGEVASELAIRTSHHYVGASRDRFDVSWPFGYEVNKSLDENRLATAINMANRLVWREVENTPAYAGMGTTIVAAIVNEDRVAIGSVGDSRAYLIRDGQMRQLTVDDSWVANLIREGAISEEQAMSHAKRNVLTQAVGSHQQLDVHTLEETLQGGDILALMSDGVYGVIESAALRSILFSCPDLRTSVRQVIEAARQQGAPDNASCIVLRYNSEDGPSPVISQTR